MKQVNVRMVVSAKTSAEVAYLSQNLSLTKPETYALIVKLFLYERDLDIGLANLSNYHFMDKEPDLPIDGLPY